MVRKLSLNFPKINAKGAVIIRDDTAVFTMDKQEYVKQLYEAEKKINPNVTLEKEGFFKKNFKLVQRWPGLTEMQVEKEIMLELGAAGVEIKEG